MLIYVADPMCSWCYGFAPELQALLDSFPDQTLRLVLGGLRAYSAQPMDAALRASLAHHWRDVERVSGQPFDRSLLARTDFVYDTEPACRAVVTVRSTDASRAWPMFHAIQRAFYAQGRDVTRADVLAAIHAELTGGSSAEFEQQMGSAAMREATRTDFALAREWEVQGFPTLFAERDGHYALLAPGYTKAAELIERARAFFSDAGRSP
ncbi:MAG: DsbA family protein [Gemmatimonadota bacterium]